MTANGALEDGTPYMWSPPPPTRIMTCQAKCAASKGCTAFVWLGKLSRCIWRKNISPSTVSKKQGYYCFSETRPSGELLRVHKFEA